MRANRPIPTVLCPKPLNPTKTDDKTPDLFFYVRTVSETTSFPQPSKTLSPPDSEASVEPQERSTAPPKQRNVFSGLFGCTPCEVRFRV